MEENGLSLKAKNVSHQEFVSYIVSVCPLESCDACRVYMWKDRWAFTFASYTLGNAALVKKCFKF